MKFLEELHFGTYHGHARFVNRAAKRRSFGYFTQNLFHHRRSSIKFENSQQIKETFTVESLFGTAIDGWIGQLNFFERNATKDFFPIISENFHDSSKRLVISPLVSCRLYSCNCIKKKLHCICFSDNFRKFLVLLFQRLSWYHLWRTLVEFRAVSYSPVLY